MTLKKPNSMDECIYFTNRAQEDGGKILAWVFRKTCPKCGGIMGKPKKPTKDKALLAIKNPTEFLAKGGKVDKKANSYICYSCSHTEPNDEVESSLKINVEYKCPKCGNEGETTTEYERKNYLGVKAYVFACKKCNEKIGITKKLKEPKKKQKAPEEDADAE